MAVEASGAREVPAAFRPFTLVGRDRELRELERAWSLAQLRQRRSRGDHGEPGIGKTRLAVELLARVSDHGARTASCAALDLAGAAPLGLWAELIRELVEQLEPPPPDAAWPCDLAVLAPDIEQRFGRERTSRPTDLPRPGAGAPLPGGDRASQLGLSTSSAGGSDRGHPHRRSAEPGTRRVRRAASDPAAGVDRHDAPAAAGERARRRARAGAAGPQRAAARAGARAARGRRARQAGARGCLAPRRPRRADGRRCGRKCAACDRARASARPRSLRTASDPARRGPRRRSRRYHPNPGSSPSSPPRRAGSWHARRSRRCRSPHRSRLRPRRSRRACWLPAAANSATGTRCCAKRYTPTYPIRAAAGCTSISPQRSRRHEDVPGRAAEVARHLKLAGRSERSRRTPRPRSHGRALGRGARAGGSDSCEKRSTGRRGRPSCLSS